jgi:ATP-dependent Clp protease ATP-binding subunit ClpA
MFERFTDRARRVIVLAQEEARLLDHDYIGTEHILLGLIREREGVAAQALESLGISLEAVRAEVEQVIGRGQTTPGPQIPFTPRSKKVLELSLREARSLGHDYIGTEHILLGLIREGEGVAAQVLVKLGADLARTRAQVIQLLGGSAGGPEEAAGTRPVPDELREVDEQLAQVRRQKEAAIEAQDFAKAAALRDAEKQLLMRLHLDAVVQEVQRLHGEVQRLRELLRQHGIEPNGGATQSA